MQVSDDLLPLIKTIDHNIKRYVSDVDVKHREISDRLLALEQAGGARFDAGAFGASPTLGTAFERAFRSEGNDVAFSKGGSLKLSVKAAVLSSHVGAHTTLPTTGAPPNDSRMQLAGNVTQRALPGVATLHYSRMTDPGAGAGIQQEGALKQEAQPVFAPITQNAMTIACWAEFSEQALKTEGELGRVIDAHLRGKLIDRADAALIAGSVVTGATFEGLNTLATAYPSATFTFLGDAIIECAANMRALGYTPNLVVLSAAEYLGIALKKDSAGQYLSGRYMDEFPFVLHGMKVCFSTDVAAATALVVDGSYVELVTTDTVGVQLGHTDDQFRRNLVTVRAETTVIPVHRDLGAVRKVTPKP